MKKIAFLHAVLIVALLSASWILFLVRMKKPETQDTAPDKQSPVEAMSTDSSKSPDQKVAQEKQSLPIGTIQNTASIPPAWAEWIDYLGQKQNANNMRVAVDAMKETVFSMESEEGLARLLELIYSGANIKTGLVFQVGKNGELLGAPDLQTLLMDWLSRMDPVQAAVIAKLALEQTGESLGPDLFVVHLRNYAKGSTDSDLQHNQFVRQYFDQLINNPEWTDNPVHSIAESMDFAVYLEDGSLVSVLSGFMAGGQSPALGHAGSMAIERLVDIDPLGSVSALIETMDQPGMSSMARAGFVARLDPGNPQEFQLLTEYLQHPLTSQQEAVLFLQYFPNLNKTLSHNLISPEISITDLGDHMDRLRNALDAVYDWQVNPVRNDLGDALSATEQLLLSQINGEPAP